MKEQYKDIRVIGFDADDTLWVNETFFREAEHKFAKLLSQFETENTIDQELFKAEIKNLELYGYGIKGFTLSMIECALALSNNKISSQTITKILDIGKDMLNKPVELIDGIEEVLSSLENNYRLLLLTKGDLLDQERKLEKSGLTKYFHHVEVLSDKKEKNYSELLNHLQIKPENFLMIGNSLKSDILPIVEIGAKAIHVPFHTTWAHEEAPNVDESTYATITSITEVIKLL